MSNVLILIEIENTGVKTARVLRLPQIALAA